MTNSIYFTHDQHLSGLHAKIYILDGHFYIEDQSSTNGTWRRLSPESVESNWVVLEDGSIFKIGVTISYICKLKRQKKLAQAMVPLKAECIICIEGDKDCLYLPCKHNVCCMKCSKNINKCPICQT